MLELGKAGYLIEMHDMWRQILEVREKVVIRLLLINAFASNPRTE